ncbi:MAG TPA: bifunctional tRNA (5-methylaminomethyl-2-thiouridine)(34)-methyltransferase MnmD/FAD-dependent 5-carboxymethylaminomethyl-2-thiouridine(34) oxidoreductase MnmC, partial [Pantoea sp.]
LARFFPAAFSFARRLYDAAPVSYEHHWSGVLQLGWDEKSAEKITQMLAMGLPETIARGVSPEEAEALAQVELGVGGIFYPLGGWLSPAELTSGLLAHGETQGLRIHWLHRLTQLSQTDKGWTLCFADGKEARHQNVALATGHQLSALPQSAQLPTYAVSGQVSHIPSTPGLKALNTVLCYDGYLTPVSPQFGTHCIGASYHRGDTATAYREEDQQQNRTRLLHSLPGCGWAEKVDVSAGEARIGVRCATRDHLPMAGAVPDYDATLASYADLPEQRARGEAIAAAPHYAGLFLLGALGSRGLCSAPLAAEVLAAQMSGEPQPLDGATLAALSPNRYWVRKLLKGKKAGK